jgi:transcriptional regulator with XRE-family HTH domain
MTRSQNPDTSEKKEKKRVPYHFGEKLRMVREHKGLTLKVVADKAGVSESLVSQIERNRVSPAIDTLLALADALDINLEFLFEEYRRERPVQIIRADERRKLAEDDIDYEELAKPDESEKENSFEAYVIKVPAGSHTHRGSYGHIGRELGIITKGTALLKYEKKEYILNEGDSVSFPAGTPHTLENNTGTPIEAIWVVTPPQRFNQ